MEPGFPFIAISLMNLFQIFDPTGIIFRYSVISAGGIPSRSASLTACLYAGTSIGLE